MRTLRADESMRLLLKSLKSNFGKKIKQAFRGSVVYPVLLFSSVLLFVVFLGILVFRLAILPRQADVAAADARSFYRHTADTSSPPQSPVSSGASASSRQESLSLSELKAINPDVEGWITIPGTRIDYPVLHAPSSSPDYYLTHDWEHRETKYGSIYTYLSPENQKNAILYGHSMKDGRMFADLLQYNSLAYYRVHPVIQYQDSSRTTYWKVFAVMKTNTDPSQGLLFDYQKARFTTASAFLNYVQDIRVRSILNTSIDLRASDKLLTLSTCSYEFNGFRTVLCARRVRTGEDTGVNTNRAEINSKVLYPDCWYKK